ncbi:hypothetical protein Q763_08535 [Flavobacterium beibuense F44-8]|uniref:Lipoprotein n=1 Tax=Flavobacterium beibuense F44-8 TaxID=1406840 RepID=A0A0A2LP72_9FLAO|nr:copper resistance protein NlpE [Flavobacterium beibuense]KGO81121.1 hypothetical protein Q763_08535 [Flavobacterium beibuense F44-8]
MKKISALAILALLAFTSCKNGEKSSDEQTQTETVTDTTGTENPSTSVPTGDNSENSLDWTGVYSGTVPCADCPGIEIELQINDNNTYSLSEHYLEKQETANMNTGSFTWDDTGSIITLDENGMGRKFKVQENSIKVLAPDGTAIEGEQKEKYTLKKVG